MVNKDHILQQLLSHFHPLGTIDIDDAGVVNVKGDVTLMDHVTHLPVQFGVVTGNFNCARRGLTTLKGAPREVGKIFTCKQNKLITLEGGPEKVESYNAVNNPLKNLDGLAQEIKGHVQFNYTENLPLLRTLVASQIWPFPDQFKLEAILNKYKQQGKAGAIKAAAELIKAGFKGNARW